MPLTHRPRRIHPATGTAVLVYRDIGRTNRHSPHTHQHLMRFGLGGRHLHHARIPCAKKLRSFDLVSPPQEESRTLSVAPVGQASRLSLGSTTKRRSYEDILR